ncbi:sulfurtransferase complex subunit TusB [Candidatus Palibaumannia cicadellinicola]|uniref:tRNA 5-methylaminomethyl-2-thiouridine synthase TusB n=1 Tax=Candidatus Palibaumannia cicadellinicola TaxID=186490 RepID=A0A088MYY6_9GAMM|nr:sulfurtransferase complex subunit TusB [Candidatus Baumannia cicadellinicola]AIN47409.1 tRNA 5-methylaminomethyl-2-thiouridine synthase TusB [Candidatus Baumannia cicadellinicola]
MLYTLSYSPYDCDIATLLRTIRLKADLLLWADGVIAGLKNSPILYMLKTAPLTLYALKNDILARGLYDYFSYDILIINYTEFVTLTEKNQQQIAW